MNKPLKINIENSENLSYVEFDKYFSAKRIYYHKNIGPDEVRGNHGHVDLEQIFVAIRGSFEIQLFDVYRNEYKFKMEENSFALYVPKRFWRTLFNYSSNAVSLVLASDVFNQDDYIDNLDEFFDLAS